MIIFINAIIIVIITPLQFIPIVLINSKSTMAQLMVWHIKGDRPFPDTLVTSSVAYICVTRPQCVFIYHEKRSMHSEEGDWYINSNAGLTLGA